MPYRKSDSKPSRKNSWTPSIQKEAVPINPKYPLSEKLQKVLAEAGLESRRALERWIEAGRVSVNGVQAKLGARVQATDIIRVDGREVSRRPPGTEKLRVLRYHKPAGEICSRADPGERRNVFDRLPHISRGRWIAVGRLDINTSGILLFTNIGELAHRLMHPASGIEREYAVRVLPWDSKADSTQSSGDIRHGDGKNNEVTPEVIAHLRKGVQLEDGVARFEHIIDVGGQGQNHWYHVILKEGKTHEVRRLWEAVGLKVSRLIRVRYGPIPLGRDLRPGRWEQISPKEAAELAESVGLGKLIATTQSGSRRLRNSHGRQNVAPRQRIDRRDSPPRKHLEDKRQTSPRAPGKNPVSSRRTKRESSPS